MRSHDFQFNLIYHGEDLDAGSIDARDLAPALIAFSDLVDQSGRLVTPEMPRLTVRVQSGFKKGSFEVGLELASAYDHFVTLFSGNHVQAWATLLSLLGVSGAGLLQLLKRAKGKKPRVIEIERSEKVRISFEDGEIQDIPKDMWRLFNFPPTRRAVEAIVAPVKQEGIDKLEIKNKEEAVVTILKDEAAFYNAPSENEDEQVFDNPNAIVVVHSPSFREGNKWRVYDGNKSLWVSVEARDFLAKVNLGLEAFRKGDILHVTLRTRQWIEGNELKAEYSILEVHKHENRLDQPKLPGTETE